MELRIIMICVMLATISAAAQAENADSIPAQKLQEIVIEAPKVIRKADMDVYHPSNSAVDNSKTECNYTNAMETREAWRDILVGMRIEGA